MKIAFLIASISQSGGMERVTSILANELSGNNFDVSIINLYGPDKPFFDLDKSIKRFYLTDKKARFRDKFLIKIFRLRKIVKKEKFDFFIDVDTFLSFLTIPALFGLKLKKISWEHFNTNVDFGRKSRKISRKLAIKKDMVVTITERDMEFFKNLTGKENVINIMNPVKIEKKIVPSSLENKIAIAVGRLEYQKGFDLLIKAWAIVCEEIDDWTLQIIGSGSMKDELLQMANDLDLLDSITFIEHTKNIEKYYSEASLMIMSSRFEGLGMVLAEGKFFGLPEISFDCEVGPRELIDDGVDGFLVNSESIDDLAKEIIKYINSPKKQILGNNALKKSKIFDVNYIYKKWLELFSNL